MFDDFESDQSTRSIFIFSEEISHSSIEKENKWPASFHIKVFNVCKKISQEQQRGNFVFLSVSIGTVEGMLFCTGKQLHSEPGIENILREE